MDLNSILNQVLNVAKNSASKLETGNQTIDSITKVGGGAALGGIDGVISMDALVVGDIALQVADGDSFFLEAEGVDTLALALLLLWTDTTTDCGE